MGRQVIAFGLGIANHIIKFKIGETIFFLCAKKPLFGQTYIIRSKTIYSKGREIIGLSGGILAELILGGIFYLMFLTFKVEIFLDCTFVIFILLIVFPILVKLNIYKPYVDGKSDMTRIIEAMRNKDSSQHIDSNVTINLFNELNVEIDKYVPKG